MNWILFWLFLHVAAAIIAFGPTFVFPIVGATVQKHPQAMHFAMVLNENIERLVIIVALTMAVSGVGLIISAHVDITKNPWLIAGIALYLVALTIVFTVQVPTGSKLVELTKQGPPPGAPPGPPPAEIMALVSRARMFGMVLTLLLVTIIFLMVVKPGG